MPTSNRPVEPVVGMEFYVNGEADPYTVTRVTAKSVVSAGSDACALDNCVRDYWRKLQTIGEVRPVLWTVGPADEPGKLKMRSGWWCPSGERAVDFGSYFPVYPFDPDVVWPRGYGRKQATERALVALWPTKAAALAAGKAHGWETPVARRVVIGGGK